MQRQSTRFPTRLGGCPPIPRVATLTPYRVPKRDIARGARVGPHHDCVGGGAHSSDGLQWAVADGSHHGPPRFWCGRRESPAEQRLTEALRDRGARGFGCRKAVNPEDAVLEELPPRQPHVAVLIADERWVYAVP